MKAFVSICFLLILLGASGPGSALADNTKPMGIKSEDVSKEDNSPELEAMRAYMKNQQQKQQKIQLLTLDLDEAKLELELRQKKAELGKLAGLGNFSSSVALKATDGSENKMKTALVSDIDPEVKVVFVTSSYKEAVLSIDGNEITVKEGDKFGGVRVKEINSHGATLVRENNEEIKIAIKE